ncbi:hypothetical protein BGW38_003097 [Lunasporangiospora selenospora]|uniref:Uncharacterized protein n=1 Tax=Lunasporangiospora selenospora TaxID=979761 RepID=A0A9P6FRW3_9FUNG|nr:hypothetical protein BGW38_003097 [Lunasporangiospora selenospora]
MPPKRMTRASARTQSSASSIAGADSSQLNSETSSPNTSMSLSRLDLSDGEGDGTDDDFLPSTAVTPSSVALGKRRMEDVQFHDTAASPAGPPKRTRRSAAKKPAVQPTKVKVPVMQDSPAESSASTPTPAPKARRASRPSASAPASTSKTSSKASSRASSSKPASTDSSPTPPGRSKRVASKKASAAVKAQIKDSESEPENDELDDSGSEAAVSNQSSDEQSDLSSSSSSSSEEDTHVTTRRRAARRRATGPSMTWMEKVAKQLIEAHPELGTIWDELDKQTVHKPQLVDQPEGLKLKLLPFQREGLSWMKQQENTIFKGGILADEMGMGKTIQMISLLLSEPGSPNLIIAPTVAIVQWMNEISEHAPSLKVLIFHGAKRTESMTELQSHDVVLTTYSIIESAYRKQHYGFKRGGVTVTEDSLLHRIKWHRIILDEAHNIKERSCNTARSAFMLQSERKWSLSGTPMQNRVGELYSLIRFMQADPFGHSCWWNGEILKPIQRYGSEGEGATAFSKLRKLLDRIMLRRTKIERADDLGLPPRKMTVCRYLFNEEEEDLYESLYSDTQRKFSTYVEHGTVLNNYANIFELLTKMRQMVDHPDLVLKRALPGKVGLLETFVCCICQEEAEDPIVSKCHHLFCREDAEQYISSSAIEAPECPVCHIPLSIDLQQPTYTKDETEEDAEIRHRTFARTSIVNRINMDTWRSSTKIEALVEQLYNLQREDRTIKSICFSQYVTFLDLIKWRLEKAGFKCVKLDGHMTPFQRDATIKKFSNDPNITVFLISLKAGGVALNLTAASRVFICDPWWNPAAELQAMDRIHRIGQFRPILITRIIIENSIESRILQLQEKKQAMVDSTIGNDPAALARLTPEDLRFLFVN